MTFRLRRAVEADLQEIWRIRHAVRENRLSNPAEVTEADALDALHRGLFQVATEGDSVVGFSAAEPRDGTIWAVFVDPPAEGRGIGRALLDAAVADLVRAGHRMARLTTDPGTRAEGFYRALGWTCTGPAAKGEIGFERKIGA